MPLSDILRKDLAIILLCSSAPFDLLEKSGWVRRSVTRFDHIQLTRRHLTRLPRFLRHGYLALQVETGVALMMDPSSVTLRLK